MVDLLKNDHISEEVTKLNPDQMIPFVDIDGKIYNESASILRYLCEKYPDKLGKYYPTDAEKRYQVNALLDFNAAHFRPSLVLPADAFIYRALAGREEFTDVEKAMRLMSRNAIPVAMKKLETKLSNAGTKFLTGDEFTIADLQLYCQLTDFVFYAWSWEAWPKVTAWAAACREQPGLKEVTDDFYKFIEEAKIDFEFPQNE